MDGPAEAGWDEEAKAAVVAAREEDDDVWYGGSHTYGEAAATDPRAYEASSEDEEAVTALRDVCWYW